MQLITKEGENIGIVSRGDALSRAQEDNLDLVMIAESGKDNVPVVKIMDFGKVLYERKKKKAEAKKHQKVLEIKEVKLSPKIGLHDYQIKMKHAVEFLKKGKRVKFTLVFKGRENINKIGRGSEMFARIDATFEELDMLKDIIKERDSKAGRFWSRVYYLKNV